jgi:Protein  of unknown function (DUF3018)
MAGPSKTSRDKVQRHRDRLRAQGMRLIQIWVPDVRSRSFMLAARKQSRMVAGSPFEAEDQAFIDAISADPAD